ncbi:MAG: DUF6666 family protein [Pirellulales bacterium]
MLSPRSAAWYFVVLACWLGAASAACGQSFAYRAQPRLVGPSQSFASIDPAPRMMEAAEEVGRERPRHRYIDPRYRGRALEMTDLAARRFASRQPASRVRGNPPEPIDAGQLSDPFVELPSGDGPMMAPTEGEPWIDENHPGAPPGDGHHVERYAPGDGTFVEEYPPGEAFGPDGQFAPGPDGDYGDCGGCGQCDACSQGPDYGYGLLGQTCACIDRTTHHPAMRNFSGYTGAQGFKGPPDLGMNGDFGFYKGVNYALPFMQRRSVGAQIGSNVAFSDFTGSTGLADRSRTQIFVTGGFFRRAPCNQGLQGGAVLDYLYDDWYVTMNLTQVRAEVGYLWGFHEIGLWAAAHTNSDTQNAPATFETSTVTWQANDQYNLYYRANFSYGAVARMWVGLSGHGDVLFGGDAIAPLSESYAILISQNYLMPRGNSSLPDSVVESWGLTLSLVWYPGAKTPNRCFDPYRPLFTVADNSTLFIRTP